MKISFKYLSTILVTYFICLTSFAQTLDYVHFGDVTSESKHQVVLDNATIITGGLNQKAVSLLPPPSPTWSGGKVTLTLAVAPTQMNYLTAKFWGNDITDNRLLLVCEGKQIGARHLGEVDMLDIGSDAPFYQNRFFYTTLPLPLSLTKGKNQISIEVRSNGPIWGYGSTWETYQKNMTTPTRGLYALYSHINPAFVPNSTEKQGEEPPLQLRKLPNSKVLESLKSRVNNEITKLLKASKPLSQVQMQFLAKAYAVSWTQAYHKTEVIQTIIKGLDTLYTTYTRNPKLAYSDPATWNADWFGLGICGQIIDLLQDELKPYFNQTIGTVIRREAYTQMLWDCRLSHQTHRRMYTNQSMINDLYGIYFPNRGLQILTPSKTLPEAKALQYLYESVGIAPWLGSEDNNGNPSKIMGDNYWQTTAKGLTKELGYVGNYGEVLDWVAEILEATKSKINPNGDAKIKAQAEKIALARTYFRYPSTDKEGNQAMRVETVVGWRDTHYPGDVCYVQRPSWDGGPFQIVTTTMHPKLLAYAQKMLQDNQFFSVIEERMQDKGFRVTAGLLPVPAQYEIVKNSPIKSTEMPMDWSQPNAIFSDEEDGVVAIKNGKELLYASLYWRARHAINHLARVHFMTPERSHIATVRVEEEFEDSGETFIVPNYTNFGFAKGGLKYPDGLSLAHAGERQPISKVPANISYKLGDENPYAGKAQLYQLQYGQYYIVMNNTAQTRTNIAIPKEFIGAIDLSTNQKITQATVALQPMSTLVLFKK